MLLLPASVAQAPSPNLLWHRWALIEPQNERPVPGLSAEVIGDALRDALVAKNAWEIVASETVKRSIRKLGLTQPPAGLVARVRIGQDVGADAVVEGEAIDLQIRRVGGGRQALVVLQAVAYDVDTGMPVSGGVEEGASSIGPENASSDDVLVGQAVRSAAASIVRTMRDHLIPSAKIVSMKERTYRIDGGLRAGFRIGQIVIVVRGHLQLATARVVRVEPDGAEIVPEREIGGSAPGDRVWVPYGSPPLPFEERWGSRVGSRAKSRAEG